MDNLLYTESRLAMRNLGEGLWEAYIAEERVSTLGELMYLEVVPVGTFIKGGARIALVESAKAVIELTLPADCTVTEVNNEALKNPGILAGVSLHSWFARLSSASLSPFLLDRDEYLARRRLKKQ